MIAKSTNPMLVLFVAQRLTGALLAALLLVHLGTIIFAVQGELTVAEIVGRVQGNTFWIIFYGVFIAAAIVHSMIGLRNVLTEMSNIHRRIIDLTVLLYVVLSIFLGFEALQAIW